MRIYFITDAKDFRTPPYMDGPKRRELEQAEIDKQLKTGLIEPAMSKWAAPVLLLFVRNNDEKLRFCVYYRKLNTLIVKDTYPLACMDECIDTLGHAQYFTTLYAYTGY